MDQKNRVTNMVNSGSKGKSTNVAQIVACLGQQNVEGLHVFHMVMLTDPFLIIINLMIPAEARGFCRNLSFLDKLPKICAILSCYGWKRRSY